MEYNYWFLNGRQNKNYIYLHILNNGGISDPLFWHFTVAGIYAFSYNNGYSAKYINLSPACRFDVY